MPRILFALLLSLNAVLFFCPVAGAGQIVVSHVQLDPARPHVPSRRAEITLNGCLVIKDIEVSKVGDRIQVKFPEYVSRKKRVYPQVVLLTRQAHDAVQKALRNGDRETGAIPPTGFAITRFSPLRKKSVLKVLAAVSFNDAVEVECKILEGRNGPWISWSERKVKETGKWFKQVYITDKKLKEAIEQELLDRYAAMLSEEGAQ